MRKKVYDDCFKIWLSATDTYNWAHKPDAAWPCSTLSGHRLFAEFDSGGLVELIIDGGIDYECDGNEFSSIVSDYAQKFLPKHHLAYDVSVGQFCNTYGNLGPCKCMSTECECEGLCALPATGRYLHPGCDSDPFELCDDCGRDAEQGGFTRIAKDEG